MESKSLNKVSLGLQEVAEKLKKFSHFSGIFFFETLQLSDLV